MSFPATFYSVETYSSYATNHSAGKYESSCVQDIIYTVWKSELHINWGKSTKGQDNVALAKYTIVVFMEALHHKSVTVYVYLSINILK